MTAENATPTTTTRLDRARHVRDTVLELAHMGSWVDVGMSAGKTGRMWSVDIGCGWWAVVGGPVVLNGPVKADTPRQRSARMDEPPSFTPNQLVDVFWHEIGRKVMSISRAAGQDRLIGFMPGFWEAEFGLPAQEWPAEVAARLMAKAA